MEVYIGFNDVLARLLILKVFHGRSPYYRRWVEVFSIKPFIKLDDATFTYLGSIYEDRLLNCISTFLGPGESIFIEYMYDPETARAMEVGVPPHLTRLGYKLLRQGFTWFKDWYFPEGFMEGGQKLQAEKPLSGEVRSKHIKALCEESLRSLKFLDSLKRDPLHSWYALRCDERYGEFMNSYCLD